MAGKHSGNGANGDRSKKRAARYKANLAVRISILDERIKHAEEMVRKQVPKAVVKHHRLLAQRAKVKRLIAGAK